MAPALSQSGLAKQLQALGMSEFKGSRLSRLEAGYADAEWSEVEALAKALNVTAHWLVGNEEPPAAQPLVEPSVPPPATDCPAPVDPVAAEAPNGVHPDFAALERSAHRNDYDFRQHLATALNCARAKLHEAGLPAAEWKHWRMVERKAMDELRKCS